MKKIPFICASSANKSHNMGVNIQTTLSMIKVSINCYIITTNTNNSNNNND